MHRPFPRRFAQTRVHRVPCGMKQPSREMGKASRPVETFALDALRGIEIMPALIAERYLVA